MVIHDEKLDKELARRAEEASRDRDASLLERMASPLNRFAAFVVDYFILAWPFAVLTMSPFKRQLQEASLLGDDFSMQLYGVLAGLVGLFTIISYQAIFVWLAGTTPGKFVFGLRVVPLWSRDERPTFWEAYGRAFVWACQFFMFAVPFLAVLSDPNRRPWHDRFSNTAVISVKRRGAALAPNLYEIALVRVLTWSVVGIVMVVVFAIGIKEVREARRNYEFSQQFGGGLSSSSQCEAIDAALEDWPLEHGEAPQRLSVAMALFATGDLNKKCLRSEVDNPFIVIENSTLAYLAKSFVYSDNQELSDEYLSEVCVADENSDECRLARVIEGMANEDLEMVDSQFSGLNENSRVYLSLWALRQYIRMQDFVSAASFLDRVPDHSALAYFLIPARAKVYWGTHRPAESRAAAAAALDLLTGDDKLQFSSWFCFAELSHSCTALANPACKVFNRLHEKTDDALSEFQPALTKVKMGECDSEQSSRGMLTAAMHPDVRDYAELLGQKNLSALEAFWKSDTTRFELKDEVARQIVKMTDERKYLDPIRNEWLSRSRGLSWEQLGRALFSKDYASKNWVAAYEVGERLMEFKNGGSLSPVEDLRRPASVGDGATGDGGDLADHAFARKFSEVRKAMAKMKAEK